MNPVRPWLYVGKFVDTLDGSTLSAQGIGAVLQLAHSVQLPGIASCFIPVDDGVPLPGDLLRQGVDFVLDAKRRGQRVLIACGAGMSRSVTFAVAALKEDEGLSLLEAVQIVKRNHPDSSPHPALWDSLCAYYGEPVPVYAMLRALRTASST